MTTKAMRAVLEGIVQRTRDWQTQRRQGSVNSCGMVDSDRGIPVVGGMDHASVVEGLQAELRIRQDKIKRLVEINQRDERDYEQAIKSLRQSHDEETKELWVTIEALQKEGNKLADYLVDARLELAKLKRGRK